MKLMLKWIALMLLAAPAWGAMGVDDARHLLLRTGMGASVEEVSIFSRLDRQAAVDRLLANIRTRPGSPPPADLLVFTPRPQAQPGAELSEEQRREFQREQMQKGVAMRAWWFEEMLNTPSPLTEKMTLFWHNHFVSSIQKVKQSTFMLKQNLLLREQAAGNFGTLLHAIARDPAMVIYLDSAQNRKNAPNRHGEPLSQKTIQRLTMPVPLSPNSLPEGERDAGSLRESHANENFARELMELFTLGEGHYSEQDIKEAARAFTGWSIDRSDGKFRFYPRFHDMGNKTVLGKNGDFDGDQVLDILLDHSATAELLSRKLWLEFVSPKPDQGEIRRLAKVLRDAKYEIKPWLRALLLSPFFWDQGNRSVLVKSPVEFLVGAMKNFQVREADGRLLGITSRQLGQDLFNPPNVKGWPGGEQWLDASSLLARKQLAERLFRAQPERLPLSPNPSPARGEGSKSPSPLAGEGLGRGGINMERGWQQMIPDTRHLLDTLGQDDATRRRNFQQRILATATINPVPASLSQPEYLLALMQDPAYQLK
ncbi:MAG: DUF1800 domain-containing protein [Sulfuricellaceae bacterium]|nr:DUF1800 domain-containing protein [Sulfuricellaceae bacterium]